MTARAKRSNTKKEKHFTYSKILHLLFLSVNLLNERFFFSIMAAGSGDKVRVVTKDETLEGVLMPSLNIDTDTIIIKLDNGYNMGISKNKIEKIQVIQKFKKPKESTKKDSI